MSIQTMDYPCALDHNSSSSTANSANTNIRTQPMDFHYISNGVEAASSEVDDYMTANSKLDPERGVKKTPSLRRGAAVYAELLQSAVKASIEAQQDKCCRPPEVMFPSSDHVATDSPLCSEGRKKRATSSQEYQEVRVAPRQKASRTDFLVASEVPQATFGSP